MARNQSDEVPEEPAEPEVKPHDLAQVEEEPIKTGAAAEPAQSVDPIDQTESVDVEVTELEPETTPPPPTAPPKDGDDLTTIKGLGPRAAEKLRSAGVTQISQIAAWTDEDVDRFDALINGRGRIIRDAWVAQAKEMTG